MKSRGLERFAPLTGVVFVALIVLAIVIGGETPDNDDSQQAIVEFWRDNDDAQIWSNIIGAWATVFFLWFAASLRSVLRRGEEGPARLSTLSFGGAVVAAVGLLSALSLNFAVADSVGDVPASVTQTLTVLSNGFFFPIAAGYAVFFLAVGVLCVRTRMLPVWLGWLTVLLGIVCLTPVGFFALLLGLVWIVLVSVLLYRRETGPAERRTRVDPASPGASVS
jgi:Domain of unknown function (DUF4386)